MADFYFECLVEFCKERDIYDDCCTERCPAYAYGECRYCCYIDDCILDFNCTDLRRMKNETI